MCENRHTRHHWAAAVHSLTSTGDEVYFRLARLATVGVLQYYYMGINANTQESGSAGSSLSGGEWHRWGIGVFAADHDAVMPHTLATALPRGGYLREYDGGCHLRNAGRRKEATHCNLKNTLHDREARFGLPTIDYRLSFTICFADHHAIRRIKASIDREIVGKAIFTLRPVMMHKWQVL
jgi:hypothetical protein